MDNTTVNILFIFAVFILIIAHSAAYAYFDAKRDKEKREQLKQDFPDFTVEIKSKSGKELVGNKLDEAYLISPIVAEMIRKIVFESKSENDDSVAENDTNEDAVTVNEHKTNKIRRSKARKHY